MKKILLPIIGLILLAGGGQGIYTAMQNKEATHYDLDQLSSTNMPKEKWLRLNNCDVNLMESVYFESALGNGLAEELYTPLYSKNDSIVAIVAQKTKGFLDVFNLVNTQTEASRRDHFIEKYKDQIFLNDVAFEGLVRYGIDLVPKQWRQIAQSNPKIVKNFIILDSETTPSSGFSYFMFGLGLILTFVGIKSFFRKKNEA